MKRLIASLYVISYVAQANPGITLITECDSNDNVFFFYEDAFNTGITSAEIILSNTPRTSPSYLTIPTSEPLFIHFAKETEFYPVYAEPGDTIVIRCTYDKDQWFHFDGTKGERSELHHAARKAIWIHIPGFQRLPFTNRLNFDYYYNLMNEKYVARKEYIAQHSHFMRPGFTELLLNTSYYKYASALLAPYASVSPELDLKKMPDFYVQRLLDLYNEFISRPQDLENKYYRFALGSFVKFLNRDRYDNGYSAADLLHSSYTEFNGDNRAYLLYFFTPEEENESLIRAYLEKLNGTQTSKYIEELKRRLDEKQQFFKQEGVLATALTDTLFQKNTVASLLRNYSGKVLYIDFWASWCGPCLMEMPNSKSLQERFKGKDVAFVFISIDDNPKKWTQAIEKLPFDDVSGGHYLLREDSPLATSLAVPPIPRYVLIDKQGKVISLNAHRPGNPKLAEQLERLLND